MFPLRTYISGNSICDEPAFFENSLRKLANKHFIFGMSFAHMRPMSVFQKVEHIYLTLLIIIDLWIQSGLLKSLTLYSLLKNQPAGKTKQKDKEIHNLLFFILYI